MKATDLSPEQARHVGAHIERSQQYLLKLVERLLTNGFSLDDPLFVAAYETLDALRDLRVLLYRIEAKLELNPPPPPPPEMPDWVKRRVTQSK